MLSDRRLNIKNTDSSYLALRSNIAAISLAGAGLNIKALFRKHNFNQNQPRAPRGSNYGGQWTDGADSLANNVSRPDAHVRVDPATFRLLNKWFVYR